MKKSLLRGALILLTIACAPAVAVARTAPVVAAAHTARAVGAAQAAPAVAAQKTFDEWAREFAQDWVRANPLLATRSQYFEGAERDDLDRRLAPYTSWGDAIGVDAAKAQAVLARRGLSELNRFRAQDLDFVQRTSAALIRWRMQDVISDEAFATHRFVFQQMQDSLHLELINALTQVHPIHTPRDIDNYLARLAQFPSRVDQGITDTKVAQQAGIVAPRFILERTIAQFDELLNTPVGSNVLVTSLRERMSAMTEQLPEAQRAGYLSEAERLVRDRLLPSSKRARDALAAQLPGASDDAGAWRLPRGDEYYARRLAHATTTSLSAAEIHQVGLDEVKRIEAEMDVLLRQLGFAEGSLQQRIEALNASMMPQAEDPRPLLLAQVETAIRDAERRAQPMFGLQPKAPVVVRREPALSEKSAAAHYTVPAPDGSTPGIYWLPLADLGPRVTWLGAGLKSTAYHEAVPGHHFQLTIQQESESLPKYRKLGAFGFISAYGEGWALYAERLADENGWYADDPRGRLGYLNLQLFRARRLVVDTGIHAMRWTRQQAIDYGFTPTEVERYIVWPGQACSYMIGQLRIVELRKRAQDALGARFSLRAFHDLVLGLGNVPLDVLAEAVDAWIASSRAFEREKHRDEHGTRSIQATDRTGNGDCGRKTAGPGAGTAVERAISVQWTGRPSTGCGM